MAAPLRLSDWPGEFPDEAAFWKLLGRLEDEQTELKSSASHIGNAIPAMAMTEGGFIVLGIDDRRRLAGCPMTQKVLDTVKRAAMNVDVEVQLKATRVGATYLTIVAVPEIRARIVTTTDGRLLRRVGSDCQPLRGDAMARFVRERENRPAEESVVPVFEPADFDLELINEALSHEDRPAVGSDSILRALIDLDVAVPQAAPSDPHVTYAAMLLFGREPGRYIPGATVQVVRRLGVGPGPGPTEDRAELTGPMTRVLYQTLDFIAKHTKKYQVVSGTRRVIMPEYPDEVLREGLLNALGHRDYGLAGSTIDVTVWDDRVEIRSPGPLPGPITLDNMRDEHYSRNRRIMRVLKIFGLVEEYGEGVDRMIREMEARLMEPPMFVATPSSVTVTLRNRFLVSVEDQAWLSVLGHFDLSTAERRLLVAARRESGVTPRRARMLLRDDRADAVLRGATAKGLLIRSGQAGGARYELSDELILRAGTSSLEATTRKSQLLLDDINRRGSLSTAEGAELLDEDQTLARHLLNDLVRSGLARAEGRTRGRRYYPA